MYDGFFTQCFDMWSVLTMLYKNALYKQGRKRLLGFLVDSKIVHVGDNQLVCEGCSVFVGYQ